MEIPAFGLSVEGFSRGADKTFLHVPQLKLALDAGLCCGRQARAVFLTHTHADHSWDLPFMAKRRDGVDLFVPRESVGKVERFIEASMVLNLEEGVEYRRELMPYVIHGVSPGDRFELPKECGGPGMIVEVFDLIHTAPCRGYGISRSKKRLAERLRGLTGKEIAARRAAGEVVEEMVSEPMFAFLGDTSCEALALPQNAGLFKFPVIIVECSFVPLEDAREGSSAAAAERVEAKKDRHVHWSELRAVVEAHPEITFVLIHVSLRYDSAAVLRFFDGLGIKNVIPFVNDRRHT